MIQAHVRSGRSSIRLGQMKRAAEQLDTALKLYKKAGKDEKTAAKPWVAEARYWQGELLFAEYAKVSLAVKPSALDRTLKKKTDLLVRAQAVFFSVVEYQDLRWATAALYRVGQIFENYAESLRNAPTPLMREMGHGRDYAYDHAFPDHHAGQQHLPDQLSGRQYYVPGELGYEERVRDWLAKLRGKKSAD